MDPLEATGQMSHAVGLLTVVGAECSGKSTLCSALGRALDAPVVPEYLRLWCERERRTPRRDEQRHIIAGQLALTRAAIARARADGLRWVISDGAPILTAAYSIEYFRDHTLIAKGLRHARASARIIVADPTIPWVPDERLRDGPSHRESVHRTLLQLLQREALDWQLVSGPPTQRLRDCLALVR